MLDDIGFLPCIPSPGGIRFMSFSLAYFKSPDFPPVPNFPRCFPKGTIPCVFSGWSFRDFFNPLGSTDPIIVGGAQ